MIDSIMDHHQPLNSASTIKARRKRHLRVFLKTSWLKAACDLFLRRFKHRRAYVPVRELSQIEVQDTFQRFFRQSILFVLALFILSVFAPSHVLETGLTASFSDEEIAGELPDLPKLILNEEGFILKTSPITIESSRLGLTDRVSHTVVPGETLSSIAALYGIKVNTILWENNLNEYSILKIGQTLTIPALDGVNHIVEKSTETLGSIAKEYGVEEKMIAQHNKLDGSSIIKGQNLFIPGGKKKQPLIVREGGRSGGTFNRKVVMSSGREPKGNSKLIFPTNGDLTQGYRRGHYAQDIGNRGKPDIWSAAEGKVTKAKGGCATRSAKGNRNCNGGYGNYVVVDHGDGLQTLYAHMETIYVSDGQKVSRGQALGKMGNSGRVYGATGIHLHFEVIHNGVKQNPTNWY